MDFDFPNDLAPLARDILTARGTGGTGFDPDTWRDLGNSGVLSAALPEEVGGAGLGLLGHCAVLTEIGRALASAPYLGSILLGAEAIASFGTASQRDRWAAPAARGDLVIATALGSGDPSMSMAPTIPSERVIGAIDLVWDSVPGALWADEFVLVDGDRVIVAERGAVTVEPQELTDGVTAGRVTLLDPDVPPERVLAGEGIASWLAARAAVGVCAHQLGVCERALELTAEHARTRVAFGRPIGTFQAVGQRLADAWIDVEAIRLTMWQAAWRLAEGLPAAAEVSTAKFWACDAGHRVAHTAVHVHGGIGIDVSYPLHRYFAAAKHNEFYLGSATDHLLRIGAALATSTT